MTPFKLSETLLTREQCLLDYKRYTEFNDKRYTVRDFPFSPVFDHNAIIFGYEYTKHLTETNYTQQMVDCILYQFTATISRFPTFGGYVNQEGHIIEEKGMILIYDKEISPVALGSLAVKISETFRQEAVLVIYNQEAQFVYA